MHAKALLITALAAFATLATAAPAPSLEARDKYVAAAIFFYIHIPGMTPFEEPSPIELYKLYNLKDLKHVTKIDFDHASNIDINSVECQAYSDHKGLKPLGSFANKDPITFKPGTTIGGVLCYAAAL